MTRNLPKKTKKRDCCVNFRLLDLGSQNPHSTISQESLKLLVIARSGDLLYGREILKLLAFHF